MSIYRARLRITPLMRKT